MKEFKIEIEDTVAEFFEEISVILGKSACEIISDVLFKKAETSRKEIVEAFTIDLEE